MAFRETGKWKYAVNTNSLPRDKEYGEIAKMLSKLKVDGVEWGLPSLEKAAAAAQEMAAVSRDNGLEIAGFINAGHIFKTDFIRRWSEAVAGAGGKSLRVAPFWSAWDYQESLHQKDSFTDLFRRTREGLEKAIPIGKEYGVRYVIEMHPGSVANSACLARKLLEGLDPAIVGIIYDPANGVGEGHLRPRNAAEILGPYLAYLHAKNLIWKEENDCLDDNGVKRARWTMQTVQLDKGILDWVEVFFALNITGFRGWISLEEFFRESPEKDISAGIAFLKKCASAAATELQKPFHTLND